MSHGRRSQRGHPLDQGRREDQVSEAQRREEHLAEAPGEQHRRVLLQTLERGDGPPLVAVLAVVVVLEQDRPAPPCPPEQREAAGDAHRHAERVLVGRRDVDKPHALEPPPVDHQTLGVDPDRDEARPHGGEGAGSAAVTRILQAHPVSGVDQQPGREVERLLDAGDDRDLLRLAARAPGRPEMSGHRVTERPVAERLAAEEEPGRGAAQHPAGDLSPERRREQLQRGQVRAEGAGPPGLEDRERPHPAPEARDPEASRPAWARRTLRRPPHPEQRVGRHLPDERPRADRGADVALRLELGEGGDHRAPREAMLTGQVAARGEPRSRPQPPLEDGHADPLVDPASAREGLPRAGRGPDRGCRRSGAWAVDQPNQA